MSLPPISSESLRVAVIGGDRRMLHAARRLCAAGAEVSVLGLGDIPAENGLRTAKDLSDAVADAGVLLLPLPATRDGVTVNCPFAPALSVSFSALSACLQANPSLLLFGGRLPPSLFEEAFSDNGSSRVTDYYTDESLLLRNAYLTAEGALVLAGRESDCALRGASAVIIGYGRIGKLLARLLLAVGMEVTVCARRQEPLLWAAAEGCHTVPMGEITHGGMLPLGIKHPMIFNTVPEPILDRDLLLCLEPDTLILDLASPPFGVREEDAREAADRNRLRYIRAPGIPGVYAPRDAGYAIADCVLSALRSPTTPPKGDLPS